VDQVVLNSNNILNSNIAISDKYGFISLSFNHIETKDKFLKLAKIEFDKRSEMINKWKWSTNNVRYSLDVFPCRIYPESGKKSISFYDLTDLSNSEIKLKNRILVLENILITILKLNINNFK
jgi:hypothetical protein